MKKFLAFFVCTAMIILGGCRSEEKTSVPDLNKVFTAEAAITSKDFEGKAKISRLGGGMWEIEFSEPDTLSGIKLAFNGDELSASYQGLSFSVPEEILPSKPIFTKLFESIDRSAEGELPYSEQEGILTYEGELENIGKFTISTEKETGNLMNVKIPYDNVVVEFTDYTIVG